MGRPEDPRRPDPDALLARTRAEGRGELRVFLGVAPGVGKTYEMQSSAARRKEEGADVVVGVVETHGRRETETLTEGVETLARRPVEHRGRTLLEFDLDAAPVRRPGLLLSADDLPSTVLQYARRNNVTQIVIGRASRTPGMRDKMRILFGRSLTHTLVEQTHGAALHSVTDTLSDMSSPPPSSGWSAGPPAAAPPATSPPG